MGTLLNLNGRFTDFNVTLTMRLMEISSEFSRILGGKKDSVPLKKLNFMKF